MKKTKRTKAAGARRKPAAKRAPAAKKKTALVRLASRKTPVRVSLPAKAGAAELREAAHYVQTLDANKQIAPGKTLLPGTTHQVEADAAGHEHLVRKRFSAL